MLEMTQIFGVRSSIVLKLIRRSMMQLAGVCLNLLCSTQGHTEGRSCKKLCDTAVLSFHLKVQTISTSLHLFFFAHFSISWLTRQTSIPVLLGLVRVLINYAPSCLMVCFTCHVTKVSFVSFVSFEDLL